MCVSSRAAVRPFSGAAGYVTGKAAVIALADALAVEYEKDEIRVNTVLPSVDRHAWPTGPPSPTRTTRAGSRPARIARVVRFLCEDSSDAIYGAHIPSTASRDSLAPLLRRIGPEWYRCGAPWAHG